MSETDQTSPSAPSPGDGEVLTFGPFQLDQLAGVLRRNGTEVPLAPKVLEVLEHLLGQPGRVVPKHELMESAWNGTVVTDHSLTEAVRLLRNALDDNSQQPTYIQTLHRRGYRFIAPVSVDGARPGDSAHSEPLLADVGLQDEFLVAAPAIIPLGSRGGCRRRGRGRVVGRAIFAAGNTSADVCLRCTGTARRRDSRQRAKRRHLSRRLHPGLRTLDARLPLPWFSVRAVAERRSLEISRGVPPPPLLLSRRGALGGYRGRADDHVSGRWGEGDLLRRVLQGAGGPLGRRWNVGRRRHDRRRTRQALAAVCGERIAAGRSDPEHGGARRHVPVAQLLARRRMGPGHHPPDPDHTGSGDRRRKHRDGRAAHRARRRDKRPIRTVRSSGLCPRRRSLGCSLRSASARDYGSARSGHRGSRDVGVARRGAVRRLRHRDARLLPRRDAPSPRPQRGLLYDREGTSRSPFAERLDFRGLRFSPDGTRAALVVRRVPTTTSGSTISKRVRISC